MPRTFTESEVRKILLELRYIYSIDEVCAKWQITRYRLKQWQKQLKYEYLVGTARELVIAGLHLGCVDRSGLREFIDYHDHTRYSDEELGSILEQLKAEGIAIFKNDRWMYNSGREFIF